MISINIINIYNVSQHSKWFLYCEVVEITGWDGWGLERLNSWCRVPVVNAVSCSRLPWLRGLVVWCLLWEVFVQSPAVLVYVLWNPWPCVINSRPPSCFCRLGFFLRCFYPITNLASRYDVSSYSIQTDTPINHSWHALFCFLPFL